MEFVPQQIPEILLIKPTVHGDTRGYFVETFRQDQFEQAVGNRVNDRQSLFLEKIYADTNRR